MRFIDLYKTDKLFFLGNIIGSIAKGALNLGKKLVKGIKNRREKKVEKAAANLLKKKERLIEAEQLVSDSGVNGKGVSGYATILNMLKQEKGEGGAGQDAPGQLDPDLVTSVNQTSGGAGMDPMIKWGLVGLVTLVVLKKLKIF